MRALHTYYRGKKTENDQLPTVRGTEEAAVKSIQTVKSCSVAVLQGVWLQTARLRQLQSDLITTPVRRTVKVKHFKVLGIAGYRQHTNVLIFRTSPARFGQMSAARDSTCSASDESLRREEGEESHFAQR